MTNTLRSAAGSLLVVGLGGPELTALERAWLKLLRAGGIILFKRNVVDAKQTRALLDEASAFCTAHAVRCVDVEGGSVNRLRDALAPMPSVQAVGASMRKSGKIALAREHGELVAQAVRAFGFNTTLAPVVDLSLPESAEVMGSRTAAPEARSVIEFAREFFAGLAAHGVVGCGKHFPGLGGAASDTHFVTPEIHRTWDQLWNEDIVPYRELHRAMPIVMTNHAAFPQTAGGMVPASASPFWITKVLRNKVGYRGIILADDLEMGGILKFLPVEEAAVAAIRAGTDLLEICHSAELILRTYEALISEAERSTTFRNLLQERAREVGRKRARIYARGVASALSPKQLENLRRQIHTFREKITVIQEKTDVIDPRAVAPAESS